MAKVNLDINLLRQAKEPLDLVAYFGKLYNDDKCTELEISRALFDAEADLPSHPVFTVFLSWANEPEVVGYHVKNGPGVLVRRFAIKLAMKFLGRPDTWEVMWKELGDVEGLLNFFAKTSVIEVKLLTSSIGCSGLRQNKIPARQKKAEELLKALLPRHYPDSPVKTQDKRPLEHLYAQILPACSAEFVNTWLEGDERLKALYDKSNYTRMLRAQKDLIRTRVEAKVMGQPTVEPLVSLQTFLYGERAFALKVIRARIYSNRTSKDNWPHGVSEFDVVMHHLKPLAKRRHADEEVRSMIKLTLDILSTKPQSVSYQQKFHLWIILCVRWWREPKVYNDLFVEALGANLGGHSHHLGEGYFVTPKKNMSITWKWKLLRLYCLHVLNHGVDIDTATDLKPLEGRRWSPKLFFNLHREQSERLLSMLYDANPDFNFLSPQSGSILDVPEVLGQKNFNVDLIRAILRTDDPATLDRVAERVDHFRKMASKAREQPERAEYARAAAFTALAIQSLELYGQTIEWQQRYVRDSNTCRFLYQPASIVTREGVELLSGFPESLPKGMKLEDIATRIEKGNAILRTFYETVTLAKREPSFSQYDWNAVSQLVQRVLERRISRATHLLHHEFSNQKPELFLLIWQSSMTLMEQLEIGFPNITPLVDNLPSASLAVATKAMLDSGSERRKRKDRKPEDDALEAESYRALKKLATSQRPDLAKQLIVQTIIERPDASSWHRQLLTTNFMKLLPAQDAQNMLLAFSKAVGEKLEEQQYVKIGEPEPSATAPPASLIKVTTVKYLAQILDEAEFIPGNAAVEVLVELFKLGAHRDIRLATLDSLLTYLNDICNAPEKVWRANPLFERIMGALESVIPVVGSVNERSPPRATQWKNAEEKGVLTDISDIKSEIPPLLKALLTPSERNNYPNLSDVEDDFAERLVVPILARSEQQHQRWLTLFLRKYKGDVDTSRLFPVPITPRIWEEILPTYPYQLKDNVLEDYHRYLMVKVDPPSDLKAFNESLTTDSSLRNLPEVQHWLHIFGDGGHVSDLYGVTYLFNTIDQYHICGAKGNIARAQDMIVELASSFLDRFDKYEHTWNIFLDNLRTRITERGTVESAATEGLPKNYEHFNATRRPIIEKLSTILLEKKRNRTGQQLRGRALPLAFDLQAMLLPFPVSREETQGQLERRAFVTQLDALVLSALQGEVNVLQWAKLAQVTSDLRHRFRGTKEILRMACYMVPAPESSMGGAVDAQLLSALNLVKVRTWTMFMDNGWPFLHGDWRSAKPTVNKEQKAVFKHLKGVFEEWQSVRDEAVAEEFSGWHKGIHACVTLFAQVDVSQF